jgi:protein TonB
MNKQFITQDSLLEIVFNNRNKAYGAYELRVNYSRRLIKATIYLVLLVTISIALLAFKKHPTNNKQNLFVSDVQLTNCPILPIQQKPMLKPKMGLKIHKPKSAEVIYNKPMIVKDDLANKQMSEVDKLENAIIGQKEVIGNAVTTEVGVTNMQEQNTNINGTETEPEVAETATIFETSQIMPEFPGGKSAFVQFLQRHLRQPHDLQEEEKITIVAKFVIDKEGNVGDIEIISHAREDLEKEVVRVIRKMPRWKPGYQNGKAVAVYYKVPVTFMYNE